MPKQSLCLPLTVSSDGANKEMGRTGQREGAGGRGSCPHPEKHWPLSQLLILLSTVGTGKQKKGEEDMLFFPVFSLFSFSDTVVKEMRKRGDKCYLISISYSSLAQLLSLFSASSEIPH